jgi:FkbM family methyltransferase
LHKAITRLLSRVNLKVSRLDKLRHELAKAGEYDRIARMMPLLAELNSVEAYAQIFNSKAQLGQDLFALARSGFKRGGFFVEFGATNGLDLSNTYLLEKQFGWSGIVAEPARKWHAALRANRSCTIETECIWSDTGSLLAFEEVEVGEYSTLSQFRHKDTVVDRSVSRRYDVQTISLADMLAKHTAPSTIDYLSIDTEGSELEILSAFDFSRYDIRVVSCEHNFTADREKLQSLFQAHGFRREYPELSRFDDWYLRSS